MNGASNVAWHHLKKGELNCSPLWECGTWRDVYVQWVERSHTMMNAACRESTALCVSSAQWQCWTEQDTIIITNSLLSLIEMHCIIEQLSYWTANLHIYVYSVWCWQKRWPKRWRNVDPAAQWRRSCWTLSQRRNAAQDAVNSMSDRPERDTHCEVRLSHTHIIYCL